MAHSLRSPTRRVGNLGSIRWKLPITPTTGFLRVHLTPQPCVWRYPLSRRGWKSDYSNQIAMNIGRMLDAGTLFEKAKNVFSLSEKTLAQLEGDLK
jgi:hypothetical protein